MYVYECTYVCVCVLVHVCIYMYKCTCVYSQSESEVAESCLTDVAYQAPLSMGFSRQEYWNGLPFCVYIYIYVCVCVCVCVCIRG